MFAVTLQAFDAWATLTEIACGAATEANPIMAHSLPTFFAMKILATGWIALLAVNSWHKWARAGLWIVMLVYSLVAIYHIWGLTHCL